MFDPEAATRSPTHAAPGALAGRAVSQDALQILSSEQWSLLSSRSMGYTEAMSRASLFIAALSGSVVALALVAQATDFGDGFIAFALVLLPVVFFVGIVTAVRLAQINKEDARWVQGLNRIRHAYLELAPELEPYFVTSRYDDVAGVLSSTPHSKPRTPLQVFVAIPGLIAVLDAVVAGAAVGIAVLGIDRGIAAPIAAGAVGFVIALVMFIVFGLWTIQAYRRELDVRFPTPPAER